jgi:hypothetical protein
MGVNETKFRFNRIACRKTKNFGPARKSNGQLDLRAARAFFILLKSLFGFFSSSKPIFYEPGVIKIKLFISITALIFIYPEP